MRVISTGLVLAMLFAVAAIADEELPAQRSLQDVVERLGVPAVLRGSFAQSRSVKDINIRLKSSGNFVLSDKGLYWGQQEPFKKMMVADGERLVEQLDDGAVQVLDSKKFPMVVSFSRIFLSIFRGDEAELRSHFDIEYRNLGDGWEIDLTPITYPMNEAIDTINLRGHEYIEALIVNSRSSEQTAIEFSDLRTIPNQLTEHEIELYAH